MVKRKQILGLLIMGLVSLFMLTINATSAKATVYLTDSSGADLVSGNSYFIMFGWGDTSSKNVFLTGQQFYSTSNPYIEAPGKFQIIRPDMKTGVPLQPSDGFIVKSLTTGEYWNFHSNMDSVTVYLDKEPKPLSNTLTTIDGSTFTAYGDRQEKDNDGYYYGLAAGPYTVGYDWNNSIGLKNKYQTELFFKQNY